MIIAYFLCIHIPLRVLKKQLVVSLGEQHHQMKKAVSLKVIPTMQYLCNIATYIKFLKWFCRDDYVFFVYATVSVYIGLLDCNI